MTNYYFVASLLPELQMGVPPELDFFELIALMKTNLKEQDMSQVEVIRRYYDIQNLRFLWRGEEISNRGNLDEQELEEAVLKREGLPGYVYDFLDRYDGQDARLNHFAALLADYYRLECKKAEGFLKVYLAFEREVRLVLLAFRAKRQGKDLLVELQYEDPNDELVAQLIAQKDAKNYEPPSKYHALKALFEEHENDPMGLHQALSAYRFEKVKEFLGVDFFSIGRILGYFVQLIIVEKWLELDKKKGMEIVETIVKEAS